MLYLEKEPHTNLSNFVKCFWFSDSQEDEGEYAILPDGYFDLIYRFVGEKHQRTFLTGTWTKPIDVPSLQRFTGATPKVLHENKNVRFLQLSNPRKK